MGSIRTVRLNQNNNNKSKTTQKNKAMTWLTRKMQGQEIILCGFINVTDPIFVLLCHLIHCKYRNTQCRCNPRSGRPENGHTNCFCNGFWKAMTINVFYLLGMRNYWLTWSNTKRISSQWYKDTPLEMFQTSQ